VPVSGAAIHFRNLALQPGGSLAVTVFADVPCTHNAASWQVTAKQANDFNGPPGDDLTRAMRA